nr:hypothetical protein [Tanacetum cinerariifolium]
MFTVRNVAEEAEAQVPAHGDNIQEPAAEEVATDVVPPTPTSPSPSSPRVLDTCSALALRVDGLENDKAAQQLEIVKLKAREKDVEVEGRHADKQAEIYNIDLDHSSKVLSMQVDDTEVQEPVEIVTTAKLMTEVVTVAGTQVVAASTPIPAAKPKILTITAAPKKDQIEMDAEYARKLQEEINKEHEESYKNIDWNATLDHVQSKEPQYIKRYHGIKKKPQTESEARKNMIFYLKNTEGYNMDFFKGKKKRLEIVHDEDDDVFVEATLLAQKSNVDAASLKLKLFKDVAAVAHA